MAAVVDVLVAAVVVVTHFVRDVGCATALFCSWHGDVYWRKFKEHCLDICTAEGK